MVITAGEKVHIVMRRQFPDDLRRHFVGVVDEATDTAIRVTGYAFVYDQAAGEFARRSQQRTQLFGIVGAGFVVTVLPKTVAIDSVRYENDARGRRIVTDGGDFQLNVSEFSASH